MGAHTVNGTRGGSRCNDAGWRRISALVLSRGIVPGRIWASERPLWFSGVRLRARTSVLRLDGHLLVHSPTPPTDATIDGRAARRGASARGAQLLSPSRDTPPRRRRFPRRRSRPRESAAAKNRDLRVDLDIRDAAFVQAVPGIVAVALEGVPFLDETLLYHAPTKTLFGADVILRADESDHWTWRFAPRA